MFDRDWSWQPRDRRFIGNKGCSLDPTREQLVLSASITRGSLSTFSIQRKNYKLYVFFIMLNNLVTLNNQKPRSAADRPKIPPIAALIANVKPVSARLVKPSADRLDIKL